MMKRKRRITNSSFDDRKTWMLVKFEEDCVLFVTQTKQVADVPGKKKNIRWTDGRSYPATILAVGSKEEVTALQSCGHNSVAARGNKKKLISGKKKVLQCCEYPEEVQGSNTDLQSIANDSVAAGGNKKKKKSGKKKVLQCFEYPEGVQGSNTDLQSIKNDSVAAVANRKTEKACEKKVLQRCEYPEEVQGSNTDLQSIANDSVAAGGNKKKKKSGKKKVLQCFEYPEGVQGSNTDLQSIKNDSEAAVGNRKTEKACEKKVLQRCEYPEEVQGSNTDLLSIANDSVAAGGNKKKKKSGKKKVLQCFEYPEGVQGSNTDLQSIKNDSVAAVGNRKTEKACEKKVLQRCEYPEEVQGSNTELQSNENDSVAAVGNRKAEKACEKKVLQRCEYPEEVQGSNTDLQSIANDSMEAGGNKEKDKTVPNSLFVNNKLLVPYSETESESDSDSAPVTKKDHVVCDMSTIICDLPNIISTDLVTISEKSGLVVSDMSTIICEVPNIISTDLVTIREKSDLVVSDRSTIISDVPNIISTDLVTISEKSDLVVSDMSTIICDVPNIITTDPVLGEKSDLVVSDTSTNIFCDISTVMSTDLVLNEKSGIGVPNITSTDFVLNDIPNIFNVVPNAQVELDSCNTYDIEKAITLLDCEVNNNDSDYSPSRVYSSSDTCSDNEIHLTNLTEQKSGSVGDPDQNIHSPEGLDSDNGSEVVQVVTFQVSDKVENVSVCKTNNIPKTHKRVWDKKSVCLYCSKRVSKLTKHLLAKHLSEQDVMIFSSLEKRSKDRDNLIKKIRNAGNFKHNNEVIKTNKGSIIPVKRPSKDVTYDHYIPCKNCLGFYYKKDLWRHAKICSQNKEEKKGKVKHQSLSMLLLPVSENCSNEFASNILGRMQTDDVSLAVRNDRLILLYGSKLFQKHGHEPHLFNFISQKVRELGRFILQVRQVNKGVKCLADCIAPDKFADVLSGVKRLCGYQESTHQYTNPSLALKLGHTINKCATLLKGCAIVNNNQELQKTIDGFKSLYDMDWTNEISSNALMTLSRKKWNKFQILPLAEDIQKLHKYLKVEFLKWKTILEKSPSKLAWDEVCKLTLAAIILFNRKRSGEAQRLEMHTFLNRDVEPCRKEVLDSLSQFEQMLVKSYVLIETRGKRGRKVPILLSKEMVEAINLLILHRPSVGIHADNPYIFARSNFGSINSLRGSDVLHQYAVLSGAQHPETITSTKLRKHIATMSQIFSMSKPELELLATFMGHDVDVHKNFYRLPESTLLLAKVSKILVSAEKGNMGKYSGKSLDEINVNLEDVEESEISDDDLEAINLQPTDYNCSTPQLAKRRAKVSGKGNSKNTRKSARQIDSDSDYIVSEGLDEELESPPRKRKTNVKRQQWSIHEREAVEKQLSTFFLLRKVPGKKACLDCISKEKYALRDRTWKQVKFYVYNNIAKR